MRNTVPHSRLSNLLPDNLGIRAHVNYRKELEDMRLSRSILMSSCCVAAWVTSFVTAEASNAQDLVEKDAVKEFKIAEADASKSLQFLAEQADVPVVFMVKHVSGVTTNAIAGRYTTREALELMLANTELIVEVHKQTRTLIVKNDHRSHPLKTRNTMKVRNKQRSAFVAGLMAGLFFVNGLAAQDDEPSEEVVELSPFVVDSSSDEGYRATHTLAGTRLRTELKDVGASISVYTKEFLEDTGATNLLELLVYTNGTEVAGVGGTFSTSSESQQIFLDFSDELRNNSPSTRVRGLSNADNTRNYYASLIPLDSYNVDRVTINRGANNILFGLGSPAGIIDRSLAQAKAVNESEVTLRFDEHGSARGVIDINRTFNEGKFNFRAIGLADWREFQKKPAMDRQERFYATFDLELTDTTKLNVNLEQGDRWAALPAPSPITDALSIWWTINKPVYPAWFHFSGQRSHPNNTTDPRWWMAFDFSTGGTFGPNVFVNSNGGSTTSTLALFPRTGIISPSDPRYDQIPDISKPEFRPVWRGIHTTKKLYRRYAGNFGDADDRALNGLSRSVHVTDPSVYDFNNVNLLGRNDNLQNDFESYNISLQQDIIKNKLGFEVAFDSQQFDSFSNRATILNARSRVLSLDINTHLNDGIPNPNFGRPFVGISPNWAEEQVDQEVFRITGYAKLDLSERADGLAGKLLGNHTLTVLYDQSEIDTFGIGGPSAAVDTEWGEAVGWFAPNNHLGFNLPVTFPVYLGPSVLDAPGSPGLDLPAVPDYIDIPSSLTMTYVDANQDFVTDTFNIMRLSENKTELTANARLDRVETESNVVALQSKFFDNHLVATLGWREDTYEFFDAGDAPESHPRRTKDVSPSAFFLPSSPDLDLKGDTFSKSFVLHVPDSSLENMPGRPTISIHYSDSENFSPRNVGRSPYGGFHNPPSGETEDYGITIGLLDQKLIAKFTWYETIEGNVPDDVFNNPYNVIFRAMPEQLYLYNDPADFESVLSTIPQAIRDNYEWEFSNVNGRKVLNTRANSTVDVSQAASEGFELELTANITPNWRLAFNAAQQEAVRTGRGEVGGADFLATVNAYLGNDFISNDAIIAQDPSASTGLAPRTREMLLIYNQAKALDGVQVGELREWRWNVITNYTFDDDSALRGFNVGGALRWQDAVAIGNTLINDPVLGFLPDPDRPIMGPEEFTADAWVGYRKRIWNDKVDWSIQLNITNVFGDDGLIPVYENPDATGTISRNGKGREAFLTSRFKF